MLLFTEGASEEVAAAGAGSGEGMVSHHMQSSVSPQLFYTFYNSVRATYATIVSKLVSGRKR